MSSSQASTLVNRGSRQSAAAPPSGTAGKRRTGGGTASGKGGASRVTTQDQTAGMFSLRSYSDEATGLKVGPTFVLVMSLVYVGLVVSMHLWAKIRGGST